ncbi:phenylalanine--tRNA ligase subunit alpha [Candidatus Profftia sp. (ex Adelges kitamiensis)]|uniref:phenylalanine--tRNA ligase subunit alpha n=1 Tax=Candidatus Profftia sp. (ex Adelges kitamiensis) TaxID=2864218 RepID=UPI001CE386CD|nr:phenylalanine--tRNA ligase subunit alpha [Candidatus Profftia sp. (ex Adelges kitamiensis)]
MRHLADLVTQIKVAIKNAQDITTLNNLRIAFLGKKGFLTLKMRLLRDLPIKERPITGTIINQAKKEVKDAIYARKLDLESTSINTSIVKDNIDVSLPGRRMDTGNVHPITRTIERIEAFFNKLGFIVETGPEIEDCYHNFDALNIPVHHPARHNHDTFWFDTERLLRTQTSNIQIRTLKKHHPPIRIISPGRVYRNDYDCTHTPMFHQMEGLIIDKYISFTNLKWTMHACIKNFFEEDMHIRFRPSYFPFTEPSVEIDIMRENSKWMEVLGCGMVHPQVLLNVGIDPDMYYGFAFGMGIERLTMLRYSITDLRAFFENDLRFLKQFK